MGGLSSERRRFKVHEGLLSSCSAYFYNAFRGPFIESQDLVSHLPDFDPKTFNWFVQWLYKDAVDVDKTPERKFTLSDGECVDDLTFEQCVELYRLANFLGVDDLEVDLIEYATKVPWMGMDVHFHEPQGLHWLYEDVPYKKPFREIACERFVKGLEKLDDADLPPSPWLRHHEYPTEFWPDFALALLRRSREGRDPF